MRVDLEIIDLSLSDAKVIKPKIHRDNRGYFLESFQKDSFKVIDQSICFLQDNHSFSERNVLRGMHFHTKATQAKLVRVVSGLIYDVIVDLREGNTFGKWEGVYLDGKDHHMLYVPKGFAHGFCALEPSHVVYKVSTLFDPELEKEFSYLDQDVGIKWPISTPILSEKDRDAPSLKKLRKLCVFG